jgi:hypothetical protein
VAVSIHTHCGLILIHTVDQLPSTSENRILTGQLQTIRKIVFMNLSVNRKRNCNHREGSRKGMVVLMGIDGLSINEDRMKHTFISFHLKRWQLCGNHHYIYNGFSYIKLYTSFSCSTLPLREKLVGLHTSNKPDVFRHLAHSTQVFIITRDNSTNFKLFQAEINFFPAKQRKVDFFVIFRLYYL